MFTSILFPPLLLRAHLFYRNIGFDCIAFVSLCNDNDKRGLPSLTMPGISTQVTNYKEMQLQGPGFSEDTDSRRSCTSQKQQPRPLLLLDRKRMQGVSTVQEERFGQSHAHLNFRNPSLLQLCEGTAFANLLSTRV